MKSIEYIEFGSGWRPPTYRSPDVNIRMVKQLFTTESKNRNPYTVYLGIISDEDATYIRMRDPWVKIKDIEDDNRIPPHLKNIEY